MKKYLTAVSLMIMSFVAYAENSQDLALQTCTEMASEQELVGENAKAYISECVKTFNDDEKGEAVAEEKE